MNDPAVISPSKTNHSSVERVEIIDDYTVRLITRRPYPVLPTQLALAHMMPPAYVKQVGLDGYRRRPIGTGPFKFVEHVPDTRIVLQANDDWWGGPQRIKTLIYRPIKEDAARAAALVAGEVDVAIDLPPELLPLVERRAQRHGAEGADHPHLRDAVQHAVPELPDRQARGPRGDHLCDRPRKPEQEHHGRHRRAGVVHQSHHLSDTTPSSSRCPTIRRAPSACSRKPAIPTASTSRSTRPTANIPRTRRSPRRLPASSAPSVSAPP